MGAIPAAVFGLLAYFFLQNSPLYLACCGRYEETRVVLTSMRAANRAEGVSLDFRMPDTADGASKSETLQQSITMQLGTVFGADLGLTTCIVMFSCFVLNLSFYGSLYAFPQEITELKMGGSPAANLLIGAVFEMAGRLLGMTVALALPRKLVLKGYLLLNLSALVAFTLGACAGHDSNLFMQLLTYYGYFGIKFFTSIGFLVTYLYAAEVFPTVVRNSGTAISFAGGRLASILSPLIYESLASFTGNCTAFFSMISILTAFNFCLIGFLPYETAGMVLQDTMETMPAKPGSSSSSFAPSGDTLLRQASYGATTSYA